MRIIFGSYTGIYEWFFLRSYPIATAICYVGVVEGVMYMFDILSPPPKFRPYKELFRCLVEMRILMQSEILPNKVEFHVHDVRTWLAVRGRWGTIGQAGRAWRATGAGGAAGQLVECAWEGC